ENYALPAQQLDLLAEMFAQKKYCDVPGLCKVTDQAKIEEQGWSLNPGRYVGVADSNNEGLDFIQHFQELTEELELLNTNAHVLEEQISENALALLNKGLSDEQG
ncbi:MAG TPA: hypothetical protein VIO36_01640, partial [Anaerolineaceae bacterium]